MQAYLDADLSVKLTAWMKEKNITQISAAVVAILKHYLNARPPSEISSQVLLDEVETLKKKVALIKVSGIRRKADHILNLLDLLFRQLTFPFFQ